MDLRVGIDMDGVLASFEHGYAPLLTKHTGIEFPNLGKPGFPATWNWDREAGISEAQMGNVWSEIKANPRFWLNLPSHEGAEEFLFHLRCELNDEDIYFVTNRMGVGAKWQTEQWLRTRGWKNPTVLLTAKKAGACNVLGLTHYIDDRQENVEDVKSFAPKTQGFMLARPYNKDILGVARLGTLNEFLAVLLEAKNG